MLIKALLPLIAVFKYKYDGLDGKCFGKQIAQVYKACKEELNRPQYQVKAAEKAG
jgi:hypothetical protein